jgi:hypothetical protein
MSLDQDQHEYWIRISMILDQDQHEPGSVDHDQHEPGSGSA